MFVANGEFAYHLIKNRVANSFQGRTASTK